MSISNIKTLAQSRYIIPLKSSTQQMALMCNKTQSIASNLIWLDNENFPFFLLLCIIFPLKRMHKFCYSKIDKDNISSNIQVVFRHLKKTLFFSGKTLELPNVFPETFWFTFGFVPMILSVGIGVWVFGC